MSAPTAPGAPIEYPESDGQPMSDNTKQFWWITVLAGNLDAVFGDRPDVFVCGNQNWYPVEGEPGICAAPDVYAVFGRPKGHRPSYKQWEEDNVPMTVVFEVRSPKNTHQEMAAKLDFYDEHGVEEYYDYDPDSNHLLGYRRGAATLVGVAKMNGYVSPRLGIRFDLSGPELVVRYPDGRPFLLVKEIEAAKQQAERLAQQQKQRAEHAEQRADEQERRADEASQRADEEKQRAEEERRRADQEKRRADQERQRADRMAELSRKLFRQEATPEELQEWQRLTEGPG